MRFIFFLIFFFTLTNNYHSFANETHVVLKVNNKIITNIDIKKESRYLVALSPDLKSVDNKTLMKLSKDSIIREKIKENELNKFFDLSIKNKFIDKIVTNYYQNMGMKSKNEFENYLKKNNLKYDEVEYKIGVEAAWNDMIYQKFKNQIEIDKNKIEKELKKFILKNKKLDMYFISEILFSADSSEGFKKKHNEINKSIKELGFHKTANIYSIADTSKIGGKVGWINESQLNNILKKQIINLKIGEYTEPITIPGGFLIVNLDDKKKTEINTNFDEEFKKKIFNERNSQLKQFSEIHYKKIYKNSTISE